MEGWPMRDWSIELFLLHTDTSERLPASCFEKAVYNLHPTFGKRAKQTKTSPPFRVQEEGWGEFDMSIICTPVGKGETQDFSHDLNFQSERYESKHEVVCGVP